jgi:hypothetical protein
VTYLFLNNKIFEHYFFTQAHFRFIFLHWAISFQIRLWIIKKKKKLPFWEIYWIFDNFGKVFEINSGNILNPNIFLELLIFFLFLNLNRIYCHAKQNLFSVLWEQQRSWKSWSQLWKTEKPEKNVSVPESNWPHQSEIRLLTHWHTWSDEKSKINCQFKLLHIMLKFSESLLFPLVVSWNVFDTRAFYFHLQ